MCHLSLKDIDSRDNPCLLQVVIKQSKTDPFRIDVTIYLGTTDNVICPVRAMLSYLAMSGGQTGPLFFSQNGYSITWRIFSSKLDFLLTKLSKPETVQHTQLSNWGSNFSSPGQDTRKSH